MAHGVLHRVQQRVRACPRPVPAVLVCLLGPPRQQSAGLSRASQAALPGCCSSQGHSILPGQRFEDAAMCTAAVPLWTPASPQRGWLTCASVPTPLEQWPLCAGSRRGVSWSATAAGTRAVPPSSRRPATRTLHTLLHTLPHTYVQPITRSRAHRAASTQPSAAGQPCTQSLCTAQGCSE